MARKKKAATKAKPAAAEGEAAEPTKKVATQKPKGRPARMPTPSTRAYRCLVNVSVDGKTRDLGSVIRLNPKQAAPLLKHGAVKSLEEEEAEAREVARKAEADAKRAAEDRAAAGG